jgi:hypothetical protein
MKYVSAFAALLCLALVYLGLRIAFRDHRSALFPEPPLEKLRFLVMTIAAAGGSVWFAVAAFRGFKGVKVDARAAAPFWFLSAGLYTVLDRAEDRGTIGTIFGSVLLVYGALSLVAVLRTWKGWWPVEVEDASPPSAPDSPPVGFPVRAGGASNALGCMPWVGVFWLGGLVLAVFLRSRTGRFEPLLLGGIVVAGLLSMAGSALLGRRR